jgi:hypothetical protein
MGCSGAGQAEFLKLGVKDVLRRLVASLAPTPTPHSRLQARPCPHRRHRPPPSLLPPSPLPPPHVSQPLRPRSALGPLGPQRAPPRAGDARGAAVQVASPIPSLHGNALAALEQLDFA